MYNLYYLTSSLDDRIYIGITNNPKRRFDHHLKYTKKANHYNGYWIRKTINEGGEIKMNIAVTNLTKENAIQLEIKMIDMLRKIASDKITNTAQGGLGFNHKGVPQSEKHKKNLELAQPHKVRIPKEVLYDLYVNQKLSKKKIGDIYGCGATTIDRRLIEYEIPVRKTPNYKISYKLDKNKIINMYINKRMSIIAISEKLKVGFSGVRELLKREGINTGLNKFSDSCDKSKIKERYNDLIEQKVKKMKIYEMMSSEFELSTTHIYKLIRNNISGKNDIIHT